MIKSLAKKAKLPLNSQPIRILALLVLGIFLVAGTHTLSKGKGPSTIDPPDSTWRQAYDINDRGDVVGRVFRDDDGNHGFLYSKGEFTTIDIQDATHTEANGINARGAIVGRYEERVLNPNFPDPDNPTAPEFFASFHGYVLEDGVVTEVAFPDSICTWPTGINDRGDIVGRYHPPGSVSGTRKGFVVRDGIFTTIEFPGSALTIASGINNKGDVVGRYRFEEELPLRGFLFSDGEYFSIDVDDPANVSTRAYGLNDRGDISGHYFFAPCSPCGARGFVLSKGKFTTFTFPGASRTFTFGINARGTNVGAYDDNFVRDPPNTLPDGTMHSFIGN